MTVMTGDDPAVPDDRNRFIIEVRVGERERDYVEKYGKERDMDNSAVIRHAIRVLNLMDATPGAWDAINRINAERLGPKFVRSGPI